jgi:hypothetical protein
MKRLLTLSFTVLLTSLTFALLQVRHNRVILQATILQNQATDWARQLADLAVETASLRESVASQKLLRSAPEPNQLSPAFIDWLLAGNYSQVPDALALEFRSYLDLPANASADYVLVSKSSLRALRPPSPNRKDELSNALCGLLSISTAQREEIRSALTHARTEFADWARQNVQRDPPADNVLVRYTLPAATEFAGAVTNQLMSKITSLIGTQRSDLFRTFAENWFQIETGYLGGVTNTLTVLRQPGEDGLFYKLTREGANSSMSEGPGEIHATFFPPAWRNIFPGGWPEVAKLENFELPAEPPGKKN